MQNIRPTVLIDLAKYKIRVHRSTIHAMGDPEYIALIVNPDKRVLGLLQSASDEKTAHKIRYEQLNKNGRSYELNSKYLVENLRSLCPEWNDGGRYRLYGKICLSDNFAIFDMSKAELIKGKEKYNGRI